MPRGRDGDSCRTRNFCTLPLAVRGKSSPSALRAAPPATSAGPRRPARSVRAPRRAWASPRRSGSAARPRRARRGAASGAATTTASATAGMPSSTSSTSSALMFSPPRMITSALAVGDGEVAVVVEHADVAGAVPAVGVEGLRGQRRIGVAQAQVRAAAEDLAVGAEPDLHAGRGRCRR